MNSPDPSIGILIVEDSPLVRRGIRLAIEADSPGSNLRVLGEAESAVSALREAERLRPEVVLLDLRLPDDNGINVCRQLRERLSQVCVIILTSATDDRSIYDSVVVGAQGFLYKEIEPSILVRAIRDGFAGRPVFPSAVTSRLLGVMRNGPTPAEAPVGVAALSSQERRVLEAMASGQTNKDIASVLGVGENTVKYYVARIFEKLGVARRAQAVAFFIRDRSP